MKLCFRSGALCHMFFTIKAVDNNGPETQPAAHQQVSNFCSPLQPERLRGLLSWDNLRSAK